MRNFMGDQRSLEHPIGQGRIDTREMPVFMIYQPPPEFQLLSWGRRLVQARLWYPVRPVPSLIPDWRNGRSLHDRRQAGHRQEKRL